MKNTVKFLNGKEYPVPVGGIRESEDRLLVTVITEDSIEAVKESISGTTETVSVTEDGQEIALYTGYSVLGCKFLLEEYETEEAGGVQKVLTFALLKPGLNQQVQTNRADIDYLMMMEGEGV